MKQEKLETKVKEILEREDFELENGVAKKPGLELEIGIYSSEQYSEQDIDNSKDRVFVDKDLEVDEAYVIEEEKEYDLPSFEVIGDVAIINDLSGRDRQEAVNGILEYHDIKTILLKRKGLSGEFRVGEYECLYGGDTGTVHKEHGHKFKVDPTEVYFSERFATERKRLAELVESGEDILVMFAGVGPFAILSAQNADKVVAIEKNPAACRYLEMNVELNGFEEEIESRCGDVRKIVPNLTENFDRIVMPLPESAIDFLDMAIESVDEGGLIHLYTFVENEEFDVVEEEIKAVFDEKNVRFNITDKVKCGYRSPSQDRYCFEIEVL